MTTTTDSASEILTIKNLIRTIPNFPKPGILFYDLMPIFSDPSGLASAAAALVNPWRGQHIDRIVGAESRGFIIGTAAALELDCGFIPVRKPGKLPGKTITLTYDLEYGTDRLEMHADAVRPGQNILMVDDLLATGGTMQACCKMVEQLGGRIVGVAFLVELRFLHGRDKLAPYDVRSLIAFDA
jgi:adenine phosphoribosyltransferase